jgi:pimeloyl-ACP methyl ester carboxylesterase
MRTNRLPEHPNDEMLLAYMDGEVSRVRIGAIRSHLKRCWKCRSVLADLELQAEAISPLLTANSDSDIDRSVTAKEKFILFQPLLTRLADHYHLVAPDYPGYGHSDWPDPKQFDYTFDHIASVMDGFTQALGLSHYTLYMQDYGGPVGFRMALVHPERVQALIVQDAVAHNEGLGANWATRRAFWADRPAHEEALRKNLLSLATTKTRHIGDDPKIELYDPDLWTDEYTFLNAPGQAQIQSDLFYDYRTNVDAYPKWQAWLQKTQPKLLVLWGKHDLSFDLGEPERYRKDVPNAKVYVLEAGHFALDTKADEIAELISDFMKT